MKECFVSRLYKYIYQSKVRLSGSLFVHEFFLGTYGATPHVSKLMMLPQITLNKVSYRKNLHMKMFSLHTQLIMNRNIYSELKVQHSAGQQSDG